MYTKDTPPPPTLSLSFFEFELPSVQLSVVCLFALSPMKSTEKFSRDTFDTFAIHSGLIRHVTSRHVTDRLLGAKMAAGTCFHDFVVVVAKCRFLTNRTNRVGKLLSLIFFLSSFLPPPPPPPLKKQTNKKQTCY